MNVLVISVAQGWKWTGAVVAFPLSSGWLNGRSIPIEELILANDAERTDVGEDQETVPGQGIQNHIFAPMLCHSFLGSFALCALNE